MKISSKVQEHILLLYWTPPSILIIQKFSNFSKHSWLHMVRFYVYHKYRSFKYCILKIFLRFNLRESSFLVPFTLTISLKLLMFSNLDMNNHYLLYNTELYQVMIPRYTFLHFPNSWSTVILPLLQESFSFLFFFIFLFWETKVKMLAITHHRFKIIILWVR